MSSSAPLFDNDGHASFGWRMAARGETAAASTAAARLSFDVQANRAPQQRTASFLTGNHQRRSRFAREPR
jgi:hypothetical protein